ncbi:MAG: sulfur carrier protein ThiS [Planctomycetota bacterium]|jgi:sulfur carrier protein
MEMLKINGVEKQFPEGIPATVAELIQNLGYDTAAIVAEIDGQIIKKEDFDKTLLKQEQTVELLRFVGGG